MRENAEDLQKARGVNIVAVFPASVSLLSSFEEAYGPYPFPLYADPEKEAFEGLGHQSMSKVKLLGKALAGVVTGKIKGMIPKDAEKKKVVTTSMQKSDVYIQGGTWLFNSRQELKWKHLDDSPESHASMEEIKQAVDAYISS